MGEIDHLLIEKVAGRVAYAVMSFGGFLGLAHSHYPIPWSSLKYDTAIGDLDVPLPLPSEPPELFKEPLLAVIELE